MRRLRSVIVPSQTDAGRRPVSISLDTIREAAGDGLRRRRPHAARPPRCRRASAARGGARDLSQARNAAADRLVQDPRRLQRRPPAHAGAARATASGRSAPATPRRASRSRRARPARRASVLVMDTAPDDQAARHRAARRHDRPGAPTTSAGARSKRTAPIGCSGHFVHPFDDDRLHQRQRHGRPRDPRGPAGRRRGDRAARRRRAARRHRRSRCTALQPGRQGLRGGTGDGRAARRVARARARPATSTAGRRRSSTAPAASRCCRRCGRCCATLRRRLDRRLARRGGARDGAASPSACTSSPKAPPAARSPPRSPRHSPRRATGRSSPSSPAATSISRASPASSAPARNTATRKEHLGLERQFRSRPAASRPHQAAVASSPSICGGPGTRAHARCSAGSTTRSGGRPRTTRC